MIKNQFKTITFQATFLTQKTQHIVLKNKNIAYPLEKT